MENEDEEEEDETEVKDECEESRLGCHTKRAAHHYLRDNYNCKLKIQFRETLYCKGLIFIYIGVRDRNQLGKTGGMPTSHTRYSLDIVPRQTSNTSIQEPQPYIKHIIRSTTL